MQSTAKPHAMQSEKYYSQLPDGMSKDDVRHEFEALFCGLSESDCTESVVVALSELSDRQWNTYEVLDDDIRRKVCQQLQRCWSNGDPNRIELLFGIAARLGLPAFIAFVDSLDSSRFSAEAQSAIKSCRDELRDSMSDPYSGMR